MKSLGSDATTAEHRGPFLCALLILLFWAALAPWTSTLALYHADERHFFDGAIQMLQTGDYLTPRTPDGEIRLLKPILGYWLTAASFAAGGVSPFTSRLPFLLLGGLVIAATYRLARAVGAKPQAALLAASIMTGNVILVVVASRALSDGLITLFLTISATGAAGILFKPAHPTRGDHAQFYFGAALAAMTKGLLAAAFVIYVLAFAIIAARRSRTSREVAPQLRRFVHVPIILLALGLACWWYVAMHFLHQETLAKQFIGDQITKKVTLSFATMLRHALLLLAYYPAVLGPWLLLYIRPSVRRGATPAEANERSFALFSLAWAGLIWVVFSLGERPAIRYVLPAMPLMAVMLAMSLSRMNVAVREKASRWILGFLAAVLIAMAALGAMLHLQLDTALAASLVAAAFLVVIVALIAAMRGRFVLSPTQTLGPAILLLLPLGMLALRPAILPGSAELLRIEVMRETESPDQPVGFVGRVGHASRLRLLLGGFHNVRGVEDRAGLELNPRAIVIWELDSPDKLPATAHPIRVFAGEPFSLESVDLLKATLTWDAKSWVKNVPRRWYAITHGKTQ